MLWNHIYENYRRENCVFYHKAILFSFPVTTYVETCSFFGTLSVAWGKLLQKQLLRILKVCEMGVKPSTIALFLIGMSSFVFCKSGSVEIFRRPTKLSEPVEYWGKKWEKFMWLYFKFFLNTPYDLSFLSHRMGAFSPNTDFFLFCSNIRTGIKQRNPVQWQKDHGNSIPARRKPNSSILHRTLRSKLHQGIVSGIEWRERSLDYSSTDSRCHERDDKA